MPVWHSPREVVVDRVVWPSNTAVSDEQQSVQPVETTEAVEPTVETAPESDPRTHRYECRSCGYVYDPDEGVKKVGIEPGTAFEDLDALAFRCPVCRSKVAAFRNIGPRAKASGFDENLDFGLGVNRMTPGQALQPQSAETPERRRSRAGQTWRSP